MSNEEAAEKIVEEALDTIDQTLDIIEDTVYVARNNTALLVTVGVLGAVAGAFGGYFFAKKRLEEKYANLAQEEIDDAKAYYQNMHKVDESGPLGPDDLLERLHGSEALAALRAKQELLDGEPLSLELEELELEASRIESATIIEDAGYVRGETNIFARNEDGIREFDWDTESPLRGDTRPYVITFEEFTSNDSGFEQLQMTYWEEDDVLADSQEQIVPDIDAIAGIDNLVDKWGYGSQDKNTVYIRHPAQEVELEVVRSAGSYTKEVMGFDENHLEHSDRGVKKMRRHYE